MKILIVNDDGIRAEGIRCLAEMAREFGQVWVVAPKEQCSAMSHRITVKNRLKVMKEDFPVDDVMAYSVTGTPADCVKIAIEHILPEKPDIVFSGINHGFNVGYDIVYSGTVGAAMDALLHGIPTIAYSAKMSDDFAKMGGEFGVAKKYFSIVTRGILEQEASLTEIWNVNFPGCEPEEVEGILWNRQPGLKNYYLDRYDRYEIDGDSFECEPVNIQACEAMPEGTDIHAIQHNCISVGKVRAIIY